MFLFELLPRYRYFEELEDKDIGHYKAGTDNRG